MRPRLSILSPPPRALIVPQKTAKNFCLGVGTFSEVRRVCSQMPVVIIASRVRLLTIPKITNSFQKKFAI